MIDFISATISVCKDTINFSHLVLESENIKYNRSYYAIDGCEEMQLIIIHNTGDIRLKGSVPYYYQGNNFTFDRKKFVPHITLARKIEYEKDLPTDCPFPASMDVEYISLMRSDRGKSGMIYTPIAEYVI